MNSIIGNLILGISLAAPLGPSGVAVIQNGLKWGFPRALLTGIGVTMADATYLLVVFFGLSGFMGSSIIKVLIWTFGALVLLFLGFQSIREGVGRIDFENPNVSASKNPLLTGYLINISNPIAIVWWVGIFGSLLGATAAGENKLSALLSSATILIGILAWHSTMSVLTNWGKRFLNQRTARYISLVAGMALILFGVRFAYNAVITVLDGLGPL